MVKLRKLTMGLCCHFPSPIADPGGESVLQTKWLLEMMSVFGRFLSYQIVPNLTNSYQERAANGLERADKGCHKGASSRPVLLKRVKPCR